MLGLKQIIIRSTPYQSLGVRRVTALPRIIGPLIFAASDGRADPSGSLEPHHTTTPIPAPAPPRPPPPVGHLVAIDPPAAPPRDYGSASSPGPARDDAFTENAVASSGRLHYYRRRRSLPLASPAAFGAHSNVYNFNAKSLYYYYVRAARHRIICPARRRSLSSTRTISYLQLYTGCVYNGRLYIIRNAFELKIISKKKKKVQ